MGLTTLDGQHRRQSPVPLHAPHRGWDLIQVGNCGSPIETDAGWLALTRGVGPVRQYAIGALLLDLHQPDRVIAELPGVLLAPDDTEREATCPTSSAPAGLPAACRDPIAAVRGQRRWGGFASIALTDLIEAMDQLHTKGADTGNEDR